MSKIRRIGNVFEGTEVEVGDEALAEQRQGYSVLVTLPSEIRAITEYCGALYACTDTGVYHVRADGTYSLVSPNEEQHTACKLCDDFGYVYLVDEDPNDPNGTIKTQRDCWECGKRETGAETKH